eukprot:NODE_6751_length_609_cov_3.491071_g5769_i0.p3 GENE.NODE_6751_length_609_cov_3.491071_g5769_i0~~NODE_6751_length_609_cov_3.491071_g5769_i0.p3  ORF type:complete len:77 (+),score=0.04 NODE_6751_length_609_cov_3.491071_g5769_i0:312-542(+)
MTQCRLLGPARGQQPRSCWPLTSRRPNGPARPSSSIGQLHAHAGPSRARKARLGPDLAWKARSGHLPAKLADLPGP